MPQTSFQGNLGDQAYSAIKGDIVSCQLPPGVEVTEAYLSTRYELGKAPVRAALTRLRQEGLVDSFARRGYRVSPVRIRDVQEIFDLRLLLEPEAARLAAGNVDSQLLKDLDGLVSIVYREDDLESISRFLDANFRLHVAVASSSGNARLADMIRRLLEENNRLLHLGLAFRNRGQQFQHEHSELIDALVAGESRLAADLTSEAIQGGREAVLEAILASPTVLDAELATGASG